MIQEANQMKSKRRSHAAAFMARVARGLGAIAELYPVKPRGWHAERSWCP